MNNNISSMTMTIEEFSRYFTIKPTLTKTYYNQSFWMIQTALWSFIAGICFCLLMVSIIT